ncbi:MAG: hypothetical protein ACYCQJ_11180 [Nitrososphaerales archaeon]
MFPYLSLFSILGIRIPGFSEAANQLCSSSPSCQTLFNYATGVVGFLFIIVCVLLFVFMYDNLRRGRKVTT